MKSRPIGLVVTGLLILALAAGSCSQEKVDKETVNTPDEGVTGGLSSDARIREMWNDIIPKAGTSTTYGISLSPDNTQQFIDWFYDVELSEDEQELKTTALGSLVAPCCDEYPVSEC